MNKKEILFKRMDNLLETSKLKGLTEEQKHLDDGPERDYWHYGYAMALRDLLSNFTVMSNS